jgi:hypothetical protein
MVQSGQPGEIRRPFGEGAYALVEAAYALVEAAYALVEAAYAEGTV